MGGSIRIQYIFPCSRGQLGHGSTESISSPRVIEALDGVTMLRVAAGGSHSSAVSG